MKEFCKTSRVLVTALLICLPIESSLAGKTSGVYSLFTLIFFISFKSLTFVTLGAILTLVGAFWPYSSSTSSSSEAEMSTPAIKISLNGTIRFFVVVTGLFLVASGAVNGDRDIRNHLELTKNCLLDKDQCLEEEQYIDNKQPVLPQKQ